MDENIIINKIEKELEKKGLIFKFAQGKLKKGEYRSSCMRIVTHNSYLKIENDLCTITKDGKHGFIIQMKLCENCLNNKYNIEAFTLLLYS